MRLIQDTKRSRSSTSPHLPKQQVNAIVMKSRFVSRSTTKVRNNSYTALKMVRQIHYKSKYTNICQPYMTAHSDGLCAMWLGLVIRCWKEWNDEAGGGYPLTLLVSGVTKGQIAVRLSR
ncbi:uncharacterized [Tachysurus ichikawai]